MAPASLYYIGGLGGRRGGEKEIGDKGIIEKGDQFTEV
jgi:hypothetical protein